MGVENVNKSVSETKFFPDDDQLMWYAWSHGISLSKRRTLVVDNDEIPVLVLGTGVKSEGERVEKIV